MVGAIVNSVLSVLVGGFLFVAVIIGFLIPRGKPSNWDDRDL